MAARGPASRLSPPASKRRGGRRPGAGAPRGNLNALRSGRYSRQIKALQIALRTMPLTADVLRRADAAGAGKRALLAQVLRHYADLILLPPQAVQSTGLAMNAKKRPSRPPGIFFPTREQTDNQTRLGRASHGARQDL